MPSHLFIMSRADYHTGIDLTIKILTGSFPLEREIMYQDNVTIAQKHILTQCRRLVFKIICHYNVDFRLFVRLICEIIAYMLFCSMVFPPEI